MRRDAVCLAVQTPFDYLRADPMNRRRFLCTNVASPPAAPLATAAAEIVPLETVGGALR
jgi:hypothetical protein